MGLLAIIVSSLAQGELIFIHASLASTNEPI